MASYATRDGCGRSVARSAFIATNDGALSRSAEHTAEHEVKSDYNAA